MRARWSSRPGAPAVACSSWTTKRRCDAHREHASKFLGYDAEIVDSGSAAVERFKRAVGDEQPVRRRDARSRSCPAPWAPGRRSAISPGSTRPVRAVVVSGYAQDAAVVSHRDYGFVAAMTKPYTLQDLQATLETVMTTPTCRIH